MISQFLTIAVAFVLTFFAALTPPLRIICYVFLAVALILLLEPFVPYRGHLLN